MFENMFWMFSISNFGIRF